ncbi:MAG: ubiquinone/menaquinone biosynthesis methyltransferase [Candidatus Wallbacteria bacterium]|nr:ubiquinone/menaquinone biosynthesis methyltransferase [Candidatus Wallbacteria bacterium]
MARQLFGRIAPRYDLANRLLSGGLDILWRRSAAREVAPASGENVLDLCTGTGDLARALLHASGGTATVHGADFCLPMLHVSRAKHARAGEPAHLVAADGLALPYRDGIFDVTIASFGVRSFADLAAGVREMARVTRPGGRVAILEFSTPAPGLFRQLYLFYLERVLPLVGDLVSASPGTYAYLPGTVLEFPSQPELAKLMGECGLHDVRFRNLTLGVAALHVGLRS